VNGCCASCTGPGSRSGSAPSSPSCVGARVEERQARDLAHVWSTLAKVQRWVVAPSSWCDADGLRADDAVDGAQKDVAAPRGWSGCRPSGSWPPSWRSRSPLRSRTGWAGSRSRACGRGEGPACGARAQAIRDRRDGHGRVHPRGDLLRRDVAADRERAVSDRRAFVRNAALLGPRSRFRGRSGRRRTPPDAVRCVDGPADEGVLADGAQPVLLSPRRLLQHRDDRRLAAPRGGRGGGPHAGVRDGGSRRAASTCRRLRRGVGTLVGAPPQTLVFTRNTPSR